MQALRGFGWVEGKNIRIDYRFAAGDPTLLKTYAVELVGMSPDAILTGGSAAVAALQQQTRTISIVFADVGRSRRPGLCSEPRAARRQYHGVRR
jgi:putative ABC transport system substrate-binding protein